MGILQSAGKAALAAVATAQAAADEKAVTYVVHGAAVRCACALRDSNVVLPMGHGAFIKNLEQVTVDDWIPNVNLLPFGICNSPENPAVQAAAARIAAEVKGETEEKGKSLWGNIAGIFCKPKAEEGPDISLVQQCAAPCVPVILGPWDSGKEIVLLDQKQPLLGGATLTCCWGAEITIIDPGQPV